MDAAVQPSQSMFFVQPASISSHRAHLPLETITICCQSHPACQELLDIMSNDVRLRMSRTRGKDNPREKTIRSLLHRKGYRFRVHFAAPGLPRRRMDIAFTKPKLAILLDGCFWHGCPLHATKPKSNVAWWQAKLSANHLRDLDTDQRLRMLGWEVVRIWEHVPNQEAVAIIERALAERGDVS